MDFVVLVLLPIILIAMTMACPSPCQCNGTTTRCTSSGFHKVPTDLPIDTRYLDLSHNEIQNLGGIAMYSDLVKLDLSSNNITFLKQNAFQKQQLLKHLDLSGNRLSRTIQLTGLGSLQELYLDNTTLQHIPVARGTASIKVLSLAYNAISNISSLHLDYHADIEVLNLSHNDITELSDVIHPMGLAVQSIGALSNLSQLRILDLSYNKLKTLGEKLFTNLRRLELVDLSNNKIQHIASNDFQYLIYLNRLNLGANDIQKMTSNIFEHNTHLEYLDVSSLSKLTVIEGGTFNGLSQLLFLNVSHNPQLSMLNVDLFKKTPNLRHLDISYNGLTSIYQRTLRGVNKLQTLTVSGNPISCDCAASWLKNLSQILTDNPMCTTPKYLAEKLLLNVSYAELFCSNVTITNYTRSVNVKIGSSITLSCQATGHPKPLITWLTPKGRKLKYNDFYRGADSETLPSEDVKNSSYHRNHPWHEAVRPQSIDHDSEHRIVLLNNGDLHIDYVLRTDAGTYFCNAQNPGSNDTIFVELILDYNTISDTLLMGGFIGLCTSAAFLGLSILGCAIKACVKKCVKHKRVKKSKETISGILDSLKGYRTARMEKLREGYHNQIGKFRGQCSQQLDRLRENYHNQVSKIKVNCSQQMHKVRDNYHSRVGKVKDYSSNKAQNVRDNYQSQKARIREYGSLQLKKLHDNYKTQQQYLIKLLEMMNMDNCKGIGESDSDSVNFDDLSPEGVTITISMKDINSDDIEFFTASEASEDHLSINIEDDDDMDDDVPPDVQYVTPRQEVEADNQDGEHEECIETDYMLEKYGINPPINPTIVILQTDTISEDTSSFSSQVHLDNVDSDIRLDNIHIEREKDSDVANGDKIQLQNVEMNCETCV